MRNETYIQMFETVIERLHEEKSIGNSISAKWTDTLIRSLASVGPSGFGTLVTSLGTDILYHIAKEMNSINALDWYRFALNASRYAQHNLGQGYGTKTDLSVILTALSAADYMINVWEDPEELYNGCLVIDIQTRVAALDVCRLADTQDELKAFLQKHIDEIDD